ncbi:hypothetical protein CEXT_465501 [Caerostris extrusa]|uniref:Uncharacterized protein n=1 Tax=Caerostris extrusa TaxID=172846 RepID=A0AAV4T677_CAEEX|nr:hypothetical protein CEXT_465501 [Caerostris extrusa]
MKINKQALEQTITVYRKGLFIQKEVNGKQLQIAWRVQQNIQNSEPQAPSPLATVCDKTQHRVPTLNCCQLLKNHP